MGQLNRKVTSFVKYWETAAPREHFPNELGEGDWTEQFLFWLEQEDGKER